MPDEPVVVLTALDVEYEAVRALLRNIRQYRHPAGTLFEAGRLPDGHGEVVIGLTGPGNAPAAVIAERAITEFQPCALLFVGVAGGLQPDIQLGDVVVGTKIYGYHGGREDDEGFLARPSAWEVPHELDQLARHVNRSRKRTGEVPPVHFRPIAAGEVVLNSRLTPLAKQLHRNYNDVAAIEMESAGISKAGHLNRALPVLTVRGISDHADGAKYHADGEGWQPIAAKHAADFAIAFVTALVAQQGSTQPARSQMDDGDLDWAELGRPVDVQWRSVLRGSFERTALEVHLVGGDGDRRIEARRLARLSAELVEIGRSLGLFTAIEQLRIEPAGDRAAVRSATYDSGPAGLVVLRNGQASAWTPLPRDTMGAVLDPDDLVIRISRLLAVLAAIDLPPVSRIVPALGIEPAAGVTEDSVRSMPRNRASGMCMKNEVRVQPEDSLPYKQFVSRRADVAEELAARLMAEFRRGTH